MREKSFKPIENAFFDYLKQEEKAINSDFNFVNCRAYVHYPSDVNAGIGYFSIGIDCLLTNADVDKTDNLVLEILVFDQGNELRITSDICWGYPHGGFEYRLFENPALVTNEILEIVREKMPSLVSRLRDLVIKYPQGI